MRLRWSSAAALALVLVVSTGCTGEDDPTAGAAPTPADATVVEDPPDDGPALAERPSGSPALWLDTVGLPVVAAVRTSTPLARLRTLAPEQWPSTCRTVATDLDTIGSLQLLTGLAITADAETATLLTADLDAKAELLAACIVGGDALEVLIDEVAATHAVAVEWIGVLEGDG